MKKAFLSFCLIAVTVTAFSQSKDNNEIKLNIPFTIAGLPEINYERIVDDNVGVGLAAAVAVDKPENMPYRTQITPFGRLYFGKKKAAGFFIEANLTACKQREIYEGWDYDSSGNYISTIVDQSSFNIGFGAALGVKLLTKNGFMGDIFLGGGRLFGNSVSGGYLRMGLTIGRRF
jgi:hypothetical protein